VVLTDGNTLLSDLASLAVPFFELVIYGVQMTLLPALAAIAKETGRKKTAFACKRNMVLFPLMYLLFIAANLFVSKAGPYAQILMVYLTLSKIAVLLLTMVQIFSCYMWICREGQEEEEEESALNRHVTAPFKRKDGENGAQQQKEKRRKKR
jgi:hypothetical protein